MTFFLTFSYSFLKNNFGQHFILWVAFSFSYLILCGHFLYMEFSLPPSIPADWCFWTVVLEKTLESPLDCKEIKPVHPKGNHSWIFIGRTDAEAETPIIWPPDAKNWLLGKDPDTRNVRKQENGMTKDEVVGWHHRHDGHEFEQAPEIGDGQGSILVCYSPWSCKESDATEQLSLSFTLLC